MTEAVAAIRDRAERARPERALWCAVVFEAVTEAKEQNRKWPGQEHGTASLARWARSADGRLVLALAGLEPSETIVAALVDMAAHRPRAHRPRVRPGRPCVATSA